MRSELGELGIVLKKDEYKLDPKPLVKLVMSRFFGETSARPRVQKGDRVGRRCEFAVPLN